MKTLKRYIPTAAIVLWTVACFCFFQFCYPSHFFYKEQNQLFLWTSDYLGSYFDGPGALACLVGDFLTQFYYYLYAGATILTLVLLLLGYVTGRLLRVLGLKRWLTTLIIVCIMTLEAWRHLYVAYHLSGTISLIAIITLLWCCAMSLRKKNWKAVLTVFVLALLPTGWLFWAPGNGKLTTPEWELEELLTVDHEYHFGHYAKVRQLVEESHSDLTVAQFYYHLSNAQQGLLADNLLRQQPIELGTSWTIGPETPLMNIKVINELYYALGDVTYAERAAMMGNVFSEDNRNVRMVQRLAECNLVSGDSAAAQKYLGILKKTFVYREWAEKAEHDVQYRNKSRFINRKDTLRLGDHAETILCELLESNPENTLALDYLLCHELAQYNVVAFKEYYDRYCKEPRLKPLYQQALLIWLSGNGVSEEVMRTYIKDMSQLERFNGYMQVRGTPAAIRYKDTYWYYFDKRKGKRK